MERRGSASSHGIKEEDFMEEVEPSASLRLSRKRKTALRRTIITEASLCSTHCTYFEKTADEHKRGAGEDLREKEDIARADYFYNVRTP